MVGEAAVADRAETRVVANVWRALPPVVRATVVILHLAVAHLVIVVLRSLTTYRIGDVAKNLDLAQQE